MKNQCKIKKQKIKNAQIKKRKIKTFKKQLPSTEYLHTQKKQ